MFQVAITHTLHDALIDWCLRKFSSVGEIEIMPLGRAKLLKTSSFNTRTKSNIHKKKKTNDETQNQTKDFWSKKTKDID